MPFLMRRGNSRTTNRTVLARSRVPVQGESGRNPEDTGYPSNVLGILRIPEAAGSVVHPIHIDNIFYSYVILLQVPRPAIAAVPVTTTAWPVCMA